MDAFFQSFTILLGQKEINIDKLVLSHSATRLVRTLWLSIGILITCILISAMIPHDENLMLVLEGLCYTFPVALSGLIYGFIGYLLLLPVQTKLDILLKKQMI